MPQPYTTEEWVVLASVIHGGKYDYSNVDYMGSKTDVEVICPEPGHGLFLVEPHRHTGARRKGCPICNPPKRRTVDTSVFVEDAIEVHGDKYDYSKVDYQGMKTECEIICPEHKSFYRNYRSHIRNRMGCPLCEAISKAEKASTAASFVKKWPEQEVVVEREYTPEEPEDAGAPSSYPPSKPLSPRYNPDYHGPPDTSSRTKEQLRAYKNYRLAVKYAKEDPDTSLHKLRKVAESYTYAVLLDKNGKVSPSLENSLDEMIRQCRLQELLGPLTLLLLEDLQKWGNYGSHAQRGNKGDYPTYDLVVRRLSDAEQLLGGWIEDFVPMARGV